MILTDMKPLSQRQTNVMATHRNDLSKHSRLTHPTSCTPVVRYAGSRGRVGCCPSCQRLQQRPGLLEVGGVKTLGEPAIDRRQQRPRFVPLALLLPEPTQAHGGPQLQRFRLLTTGHGESLLETDLGVRHLRG